MRERYLQAYIRWVLRHHKLILAAAFIVSALALTVSILFLKTQTGILDLYSEKEPAARRFMQYVEKFGAAETLIVVFEGEDESQRRKAMEQLAQHLAAGPKNLIQDLLYKIDLRLFKNHAFQFLKEEDARKILQEARSVDGGIRMFFQAQDFNDYLQYLNNQMEKGLKEGKKPEGNYVQDFAKGLEPLFLLNDFLAGVELPAEAITTRLQGDARQQGSLDDLGYFRTEDGKMHIMLIRPVDRKQDYREAKVLVDFVRDQIDQVQKSFPQITIGVTGGPALNNDQFEISRRDMTRASTFAFISTGILFILAFKSFGRPLLSLTTLALSITWCFGLATLTVGHLNLFSLAFIVILVGQGTHDGVQFVSRYEEELLKGFTVPQAITNTITHIFGSITTSTITTAAAFFATMLVPLKGFAELGWIAGTGIVLASLGIQMVLPCFLLIYDGRGPRGNLQRQSRTLLGETFKRKWYNFCRTLMTTYAPLILGAVLLVALWGAYLFFSPEYGIPFDSNLLNLQAKGTEAVKYEKKLIETSLSPRAGIFTTKDLAEAQRIAKEVKKQPTVQRVEWLGEVFPEGTIQGQTHERLREAIQRLPNEKLRSPDPAILVENLNRMEQNLEKISEQALTAPQGEKLLEKTEEALEAVALIREKIPQSDNALDLESQKIISQLLYPQLDEFQKTFFGSIREMFNNAAQAEKLEIKDIPPEIVSRFVSEDQTYAIYAFPSVNIWEKKPLDQFVGDLRKVEPNVTGPPVMFYEILTLVRTSYFKAAGLSAFAILMIFLIDFKSIRYTLLAYLPLIVGLFCLFGLMSLFQLSFNTANMIALPMILGIGANNGVYIIHRFREENESSIDFMFRSTGKALFVSYLDTLTSFVGLALANHQGLAQLGGVVILGITCTTAAGLLCLPSIMVLMIKRRVKNKK